MRPFFRPRSTFDMMAGLATVMTAAFATIATVACVHAEAASPAWVGAAAETILECNFDSKTIDQPIGIGGPSVNEPVDLNEASAMVRATPLTTPCLEIVDDSNSARSVRFEFLNDAEIVSGQLTVTMTLQMAELQNCAIALRENSSASQSFLDVYFFSSGVIRYSDLDTPLGSATIGTYAAGVSTTIQIQLDMDARVYDLQVGGSLLLDDEPLGTSARGIGSVLVGYLNDVDTIGTLSVDDVLVTATVIPTAVETESWGAIKSRWR